MEGRLYRVAQAMLWREADSLDAVQEAVFRGWMKKETLHEDERFEPWLVRILVNECRDALRRRRRDPVALETDVSREDHLCEDLQLRLALRRLSVAAAFAVLVLGIALAAGKMTRPRQDAVVAAVDGAEGIAAELTPTPMPAAEPEYTPTPMPSGQDGVTVYYSDTDAYYHGDDVCCGRLQDRSRALDEALRDGKERCPICQPVVPDGYNLFLAAFGQGLDALYPGFTYAFRGMNSAHYDNNTWYVSDGERIWGACTVCDHYSGEGAGDDDEVCFTLTADGHNDLWRFLSDAPQAQWGMIVNEATEDAVDNARLAEGIEEVADGMILTSVRAVVKPSGLIDSAWMSFFDAHRTIRVDAGFALQEDGGYEIWISVNGVGMG